MGLRTVWQKGFALVPLLLSLASPAQARNYVLQIAFVDEIAITQQSILETAATLRAEWPEAEVRTLAVRVPRTPSQSQVDRGRADMLEELRNLALQPEDQVKMLVIHTHGNSGANWDETNLTYIGAVSPRGMSFSFNQFFLKLRPFVAKDLRVVLDSCNTLCGKNSEAALRARAFLEGLGAPDGSIYGAVTNHYETATRALPNAKKLELYIITAGTIAALSGALLNLSTGPQLVDIDHMLIDMVKLVPIYTAMFYVFDSWINPLLLRFKSRRMVVNFGRIFAFRNGEVIENKQASWVRDQLQLLGQGGRCESLFSP